MQTLVTGLVLTAIAVVAVGLSTWQSSKARRAGRQAADANLRALQRRREGAEADGGEHELEDEHELEHEHEDEHKLEEELTAAQRRHASRGYALKRAAIILLAVGLLGVVGGSLDVWL